jgi:hypothetical protein
MPSSERSGGRPARGGSREAEELLRAVRDEDQGRGDAKRRQGIGAVTVELLVEHGAPVDWRTAFGVNAPSRGKLI